jgi:alpha-tubulin suppressor-like RCC1 family protein
VPKNEFIQSVCCGYDYILCLTENGEVFAWGNNDWGQAGCGSDDRDICEPIKLQYFNRYQVIYISSGMYDSLALTKDGKVHDWDLNHNYNHNYKSVNKPLPIHIPGILIKAKLWFKT